ncbi:expressed unknown protein [Seminavis robusta]|uniref:Uncharacterized protein n=1 Tax=Seminavis robusta TaxID=568900 RepID=A0A9N8DM35_9STRA|nr:expressed unknown protein [Seminavis robusta]|eukprot:Sro155_g070290.1 n/a (388) ;mRNA; f:7144-8307
MIPCAIPTSDDCAATPIPGQTLLVERVESDDLQAMEKDSRAVLWRAETSMSDGDEDATESSEDASVLVVQANSPQGEALRLGNDELSKEPLVPVKDHVTYSVAKKGKDDITVRVDVEKYMSSREMTPLQERWNALTMIPQPLLCVCYLLSGNWVSGAILAEATKAYQNLSQEALTEAFENDPACFDWSHLPVVGWLFRHMYAMPPLPLLFITAGCVSQLPFSFLYHWKYAHALTPSQRTDHWSRRMDQSMIHVSSALSCYGTSGYWDYFLVNCIYNADSIYRQFQPKVIPRRNQGRLGVAIAAWAIPVLRRGEWDMFMQLVVTLGIGFFLFLRYPIGGWSHAAFHLTLIPLMALLMKIGTDLPASQGTIQGAAQCFAMADLRHAYST